MRLFILLILFTISLIANDKLRIGVLAYGTVNWELQTIKNNNLDKKYGFDLEVVKLASKKATTVAFMAKDVDIIVNDWIWVNTQRANNKDYTFYPYSKAIGTLLVPNNSSLNSLKDLKSKNLGIAGGAYDKTWLLFNAYYKKEYHEDLSKDTKKIFASPPIIYKKMLDGTLDASLNFWHFNSKLLAKDYKSIISINDILKSFNVFNDIPFIGYCFDRKFATQNKKLINSFLKASMEAKALLKNSDEEWNKIRPLMNAKNKEVFNSLKQGFKAGILDNFDDKNIKDMRSVFSILYIQGGRKLVGKSRFLVDDTFWKM